MSIFDQFCFSFVFAGVAKNRPQSLYLRLLPVASLLILGYDATASSNILSVLGTVIFHHFLWILSLFLLSRINAEILLILIIITQLHCVMLKPKSWKKIIIYKVLSCSDHDKYQFGFKQQHSTTLCVAIRPRHLLYETTNNRSFLPVCFLWCLEPTPGLTPSSTH